MACSMPARSEACAIVADFNRRRDPGTAFIALAQMSSVWSDSLAALLNEPKVMKPLRSTGGGASAGASSGRKQNMVRGSTRGASEASTGMSPGSMAASVMRKSMPGTPVVVG